jgi:hypothetical protein
MSVAFINRHPSDPTCNPVIIRQFLKVNGTAKSGRANRLFQALLEPAATDWIAVPAPGMEDE